jgi:hypothetical protein
MPTAIAKRLTAILFAVSAVILIAGGAGLYVLQAKIAAADKQVEEKQAQVGSNEQITRRYQSTLDNYNTTMEQLKYLEPSVDKKNYVPTLVQQLQRVSQADHLKVVAVRPSAIADPPAPKVADNADGTKAKAPPPPPYKTMNVALSLEGTYAQIMTFAYHMTRFPKIVSVQSVAFTPKGSTDGSITSKTPLLGAEINLTAYIFDDTPKTMLPGTAGGTLTSDASSADNGNPIAYAAGRVAASTRSNMKSAGVSERTGGLLEPAASGQHSIKGGFASEQNTVR